MRNPFRYFNSSPEITRLAVMMYIRYPLSLRQIKDLLFERGIDICHETGRFWWNRFGLMSAAGALLPFVHTAANFRFPPVPGLRSDRSERLLSEYPSAMMNWPIWGA